MARAGFEPCPHEGGGAVSQRPAGADKKAWSAVGSKAEGADVVVEDAFAAGESLIGMQPFFETRTRISYRQGKRSGAGTASVRDEACVDLRDFTFHARVQLLLKQSRDSR